MKAVTVFLVFLSSSFLYAQTLEDISKAMDHAVYPVMKSHKFMGVMPVKNPVLPMQASKKYKLAIDLLASTRDSLKVNFSITDIGRTYNLHVANGVDPKNLEIVVVAHGPAVWSLLTHEAFEKKYGLPNPNIAFIKELHQHNVKFFVCGQNLTIMNIDPEDLVSEIQVALSAKTALTHFQALGYAVFEFSR